MKNLPHLERYGLEDGTQKGLVRLREDGQEVIAAVIGLP